MNKDIELLLEGLRTLEEAGLYNICYRRAGVGLMFYEEDRARQRLGDTPHTWGVEFSTEKHFEMGLVVYTYYPSLQEAVQGELLRLDKKSQEEREGALRAEVARAREVLLKAEKRLQDFGKPVKQVEELPVRTGQLTQP